MKTSRKTLSVAVSFVMISIFIIGCGGGGGSSTTTPSTPPVVPSSVAGTVIDGYVKGGTVCEDSNENGQCDLKEPTGTTKEDGTFTLTNATGTHTILAYDGVSIDTNLSVQGIMSAPKGSTVITPATTLLASLIKSGMDEQNATNQLKTAFNMDSAVTAYMITKQDPISLMDNNTTGAASLVRSIVQIQNTLTQIAAAVRGTNSTINANVSLTTALSALSDSVGSTKSRIDTNSTHIETIFKKALNNNGLNSTPTTITDVSLLISTINQNTESLSQNNTDTLKSMATIAIVGQKTSAEAIETAIKNHTPITVNVPQAIIDANQTATQVAQALNHPPKIDGSFPTSLSFTVGQSATKNFTVYFIDTDVNDTLTLTTTLNALGLSFANGILSGIPSTTGSFSGTITATDKNGLTVKSDTITITIQKAIEYPPNLPLISSYSPPSVPNI